MTQHSSGRFSHLRITSLESLNDRVIRHERINHRELADAIASYEGSLPPVLREYIASLIRQAPAAKGRPKLTELEKRRRANLLRYAYRVCKRYVRRYGQPDNLPPDPVPGEAFYEGRSPSELAAMMVASHFLGCPTKYRTVQTYASSEEIR